MPGAISNIMVALSGGVDSAVAALRLRQAGHAVSAVHMTNWEEADRYCPAARDHEDARRVATELGLAFHHVNFARKYRDEVFAEFLAEYRAGRTPNPDITCNRRIKFRALLDYARRAGADYLATGHYARIEHGPRTRLLTAADAAKDQTYFLHAVDRDALHQVVFPLGSLTKAEVRRIAVAAGLPNHARRDSTGICFIGERPFEEFLSQYIESSPGPILSTDGREVGRHRGLPFYTLGQRSGLGIGGRRGVGLPWFVMSKDSTRNALIVAPGRSHPGLWSRSLVIHRLTWINATPGPDGQVVAGIAARIRHRQPPAACRLILRADDSATVEFDAPQWAAAPGQSVVFYRGDECLGGAVISSAQRLDQLSSAVADTAVGGMLPL